MALRAGYYGLKRSLKDKLFNLAASMPADISPDNPIAGKNDVLTSIDLLDDTVGWISKNELPNKLVSGSNNHVNYSVKEDKSVEIYTDEGGSTAQTTMLLVTASDNCRPKAGQKILSVSEEATGIQIVVTGYNGTQWVKNLVNTNTHTLLNIDYNGYDRISAYLLVNANNEIDHKIAYPMIVDVDTYKLDSSYEPYHKSVEDVFAGKVSIGRLINTGDDLNDVMETGIYSIANAPTNSPESTGFCSLIVDKSVNGDIRQIIIKSGSAAGYIYVRSYAGSPLSWQPWYKFTGTEVTPASLTKEDETKKATKKKVIKEEE